MTINDFSLAFDNLTTINPISPFEWEIETNATFATEEPIKIYIQKEGNSWYFTDKKETLKFMNDLYELKSVDVKHCISSVIKIYGYTINAGALRAEITDEASINKIFFNFIMCIGQLGNMYAFFDKPE